MKIIIRADSSSIIGSGHIMRCLVLADELKSETIFACRNLSGNIISVIESRGYNVKVLPDAIDDANQDFLGFLKHEKPEILIFDNYDTDIELERKSRHFVHKIVIIDDLANRKHDCDILIDQNPCPMTHARYGNLVPLSSIKLLGLKYALLGKEFLPHRKVTPSATIKNILIFFGGGDHKNLTQKVIEAIINSSSHGEVNFNVVVGSSNQNREKIRAICEAQKNFTFHCQINNMAELMQQADLFIGAGGTTSWERMCIGLPGIIISIAENQEESCHELAKLDVIKYLGTAEDFTLEKLLHCLEWIKKNPDWLLNAVTNGQKMVDGCGTKIIAPYIKALSKDFNLRPLEEKDSELILNWRNSDNVRKYMLNDQIIEEFSHNKWFKTVINSEECNYLIFELSNKPLGLVYFTKINQHEQSCEWGFYLGEQKISGMGTIMCIKGLLYAQKDLNIKHIISYILPTNIRSIFLHKKLGFQKNLTPREDNLVRFDLFYKQ